MTCTVSIYEASLFNFKGDINVCFIVVKVLKVIKYNFNKISVKVELKIVELLIYLYGNYINHITSANIPLTRLAFHSGWINLGPSITWPKLFMHIYLTGCSTELRYQIVIDLKAIQT